MSTISKATVIFLSNPVEGVLHLSGSGFMRSLDFGTAWTTLRVGVRMRMVSGEANFLTWGDGLTPRFGIGLCSSAGGMVTRAGGGHWIGLLTTGAQWTTNPSGSPGAGSFNFDFGSTAPGKKVGSTFTAGTNFASGVAVGGGFHDASSIFMNQTELFIDITKGSPNYSFRVFGIANPANGAGNSRANWEEDMEESPPTRVNYIYQAAQTLAVDEGVDGVLDAICIFNELPLEAEIWDHGLVRLA